MTMAKKTEDKKERGRPSTYNFELCEEICAKVAEGKSIKAVLKEQEYYPSFQTWCNWKNQNDELFDLYTRTMQDKGESMDAQIDEIMQEVKDKKIDFAAARLLIDTLKWKASKYYPKRFGENKNVDHTSGGKAFNIPPIQWIEDEEEDQDS